MSSHDTIDRFQRKRMRDRLVECEIGHVSSGAPREDALYEYRDESGRVFELRYWDTVGSCRWFVSEFRPNGRVVMDPGNDPPMDIRPDCQLEVFLSDRDPSAVMHYLWDAGLYDRAVMGGVGPGIDARYYGRLDEAVDAIAEALAADVWLDSADQQVRAERKARESTPEGQLEQLQQSVAVLKFERALIDAAIAREDGRYSGLHHMGGDFSREARWRLNAFFAAPSAETWENVAHLQVLGFKTARQVWSEFDPDAPDSLPAEGGAERWPRVPGAADFEDYLARAVTVERERREAGIEETDARIAELCGGPETDQGPRPV